MGSATAPGMQDPAIETLASTLRGAVIRPNDERYNAARKVYNGMIERRPRLIVECAGIGDVIRCVNFARERQVDIAVRGGGHSVPGFGTCDDGIVIDLGHMKSVRVEPARQIARVEGGCTWGDVDHATHTFGLATPGGLISSTGVGGLTTGGGFGHLSRRYGLVCDNLLSADVVTADGTLRTASATENPDLFWAIRGGGGNFGIVTSFELRLYPVSTVYAGPVLYDLDKATEAMHFFDDFMRQAPRDLSAFFAFMIVPPGPPFPEHLHMKTLCAIMFCYCGDPAAGEALTQPLRAFGPPAFAFNVPMPYPVLQSMFDPLLPPGLQHYWKADFSTEMSDGAIAAHVSFGPRMPTVNSAMHVYPMDGAIQDTAADATAFAYRNVRYNHIIAAVSADAGPMPEYREWVRNYWTALHPFSAGGSYVNFLMDEGDDRIASSYTGNYQRLRAMKAKYDPENLFHVNQNIKPAA